MGKLPRSAFAALLSLASSPAFAQTKPAPAPALPPPAASVRVIAPSATGPWVFAIENLGTEALRVPADVRLLTLEVDTYDAKNKKKTVKCALPGGLRVDGFPDKRALLLDVGQRYTETFDPHLFCFGKDADALAGASAVRARFGWPGPKTIARGKAVDGPFAVQGVAFPADVAPQKDVVVPSILLPFRAAPVPPELKPPEDEPKPAPKDAVSGSKEGKPAAKDAKRADRSPRGSDKEPKADKDPKPLAKDQNAKEADDAPKIVDENAARLELTSDAYSNASAPERATVGVTITNAGHRPMTVALLPRMLSFRVDGADGSFQCDSRATTRAVPRDMFRTLKDGASVKMSVVLGEVCPDGALHRQGLYKVTATLRAGESGSELGLAAYSATIAAKAPTLLRLETAPLPFYATPPKAVPPKTEPAPEKKP